MTLADLLGECIVTEFKGYWTREEMATSVRTFAVQLTAAGCPFRETKAIFLFTVERFHRAI